MASNKKTLTHFDAMHDVLVRQLPLPGIGEPVPDDSWKRVRAARKFIRTTKAQTAFAAEISRLARRTA